MASEVCKLLISSGQWKDGEVDQGRSYAELWVISICNLGVIFIFGDFHSS